MAIKGRTTPRGVSITRIEEYKYLCRELFQDAESECSRHALVSYRDVWHVLDRLLEFLDDVYNERRVKRWRDTEHFQRWLATYCLAAEKRMRRMRDHSGLVGLWVLLRSLTEDNHEEIDEMEEVA